MDYSDIINYIFLGDNHERKKSEVRKRFNISCYKLRNMLIQLSWTYALYENESGHRIGLLKKEKIGKYSEDNYE